MARTPAQTPALDEWWVIPRGPIVKLADGTAFPAVVECKVGRPFKPGDPPPPFVELRLVVVNGHPEVASFAVVAAEGGPGVTSADWRYWKFDALRDEAVRRAGGIQAVVARAFGGGYLGVDDLIDAGDRAGAAALSQLTRRRVLNDALKREVAEVVKAAPPGRGTKAVREHFGISQRNASRWVGAASDGVHLPKKEA
jgi:hypothetical protein